MASEWEQVVYAADCDEDGNCPRCGIDFADCPCIGPTEDDVEYQVREDRLYARRVVAVDFDGALAASRDRLTAAGLWVAVWSDGKATLVTKDQIPGVWFARATVFSPSEMYDYIRLPEKGRKLFRELKGLKPPKGKA